MAKFLSGTELNLELENIFKMAKKQLILISPYIKLPQRITDILDSKKDDRNLKLIIVFGKNDDDYGKSMNQKDFNLFKQFQNVKIHYRNLLHACKTNV